MAAADTSHEIPRQRNPFRSAAGIRTRLRVCPLLEQTRLTRRSFARAPA